MSTAYRLRLQNIDTRDAEDFDVSLPDSHSSALLFEASSFWTRRRAQIPTNATIAKPGRQAHYKAFSVAVARDHWL